LNYGCCSGAGLDGTRAYITVTSASPQSLWCILFSSFVTSLVDGGQLETGDVLCGPSSPGLDLTCSLSNNLVKYVERLPHDGSAAVCYPHGQNSLNTANFFTLQDIGGNGTWYAYIDGDQKEGQSGYTANVRISEAGEESQADNSCTGWGGSAAFSSWQRDNYATHTWTTVQQASILNTNNCWSVGGVTNGAFSIGH
jgi:hypothetical protein